MREFLDIDKRDREILSLLERNPEMPQSDIAEKLKISQPSVSARMHKLKQKGALAHVVGMNLKKVNLYMAKVDVIANNTSSVLDIFKDCPYFLNGLIVSGKHNLCLFFIGEDIATLEAIVDGHLRSNPLVKGAEVSIVIASCGQCPRHAPRPSQNLSSTSFALPLIILIAPSAQLGIHNPHPLHLSSSINTMFLFILSNLREML